MKNENVGFARSWILVLFAVLGLTACAEPPQTSMDEATASLEEARTANGKGYAPDAIQKAEEAYAAAMAEVELQNDRNPFMRSYGKATELLTEATGDSNKAKEEAESRREEMHAEADGLIADVQKRFESAEVVTEQARRPEIKGTLEEAGTMLLDAEKASKAGDYLSAYEKAQDAQALIEEVMSDAPAVGTRLGT
jgi:hypothetical protein